MIELIAEHNQGKVTVRGVVNDNLIVTDPKIDAVTALKQFAILVKHYEKVDLWRQNFRMTHEYTENKKTR